jgi:hypothetical protein
LEERLKIFISWSGKKSKKAAKALQNWLPKVIQAAEPWMSDDIPAGKDPLKEINSALEQARYGVVCLTAGNMTSGFIIHETIELRKNVIDVCPYIIDLDIQRRYLLSPFNQLQAKMADLEGTEQLVLDINKALGSPVIKVDTLRNAVRSNWKELEEEFERIRREKEIDLEKIIQDFCETFMDVNRYRASLNFSSSVDVAIDLFVAKQYNRETILEHALEAIKESRDLFDRRSILVGNVRDFLKEHFTEDDIGNMHLTKSNLV